MRYALTSVLMSLLGAVVILALTFDPGRSAGQDTKDNGAASSQASAGSSSAAKDTGAGKAAGDKGAGDKAAGDKGAGAKAPEEKADYVGAETCLECHSTGYAQGWLQTPHGRFLLDPKRKVPVKGCEECHGPGSLHIMDPPAHIIALKKAPPRQSNDICLKCHTSEVGRHDWKLGAHAMANMRCADCHKVHQQAQNTFMLLKPKNELCFSCHKDIFNQLHLNSHHPVLEGKVDCTDRHNIHSGANDHMLVSDEKTTCTRCHADIAGPFVYEHDVTVNGYAQACTSCHRPHGSPNVKLFKVAGNGLCLRCHAAQVINHFPGDCVTCHTRVHGSNTDEHLLN